jgi:UDP-glucose 4-epimerase
MRYRGKRALVTGGLGFIGSSLSIRLVEEGAEVTIVDSSVPGCGANSFNLAPVRGDVRIIAADLSEPEVFRNEIAAADIVFNLAGEISHIHSMKFPERDLQINTVAQLRFLMECARTAPGIRVVYASTRQIYGIPDYLPIDERHPIQPVDFNGVHKYAASMYHQMLSRTGLIDGVVLRLTNVYGPRMALDVPCQGFLNTFLRRLVLNQPLQVYGDGRQLRDPMYIDDAVEAFLLAGVAPIYTTRSYNVGGAQALSITEIAETAVAVAGTPGVEYLPFPEEVRQIDIGSYTTDSALIQDDFGWRAGIRFDEGIARALDYYRENLGRYLDPSHPHPACKMPEHSGAAWRLMYAAV